jgi:RNA-splicing ligase RtcB
MRQALAMATNVGFVYRLATVAAIRDALADVFGGAAGFRLLADIAHNTLFQERHAGSDAWVARHNACRLDPASPVLIAGAHDVPSYVGRADAAADPDLHSYDHGAGHLIADRRAQGRLAAAHGITVRLKMSRGARGRVLERELVPLRDAEPIERLFECLERRGMLHPSVRLRPLGTLKN